MSRAYYNENDAHAAGWLRNLVAAGHLPAGTVDDRSILDVGPGDLDGYVRHHFFAGIAGWELALQLAGWPATRPVWTGSAPCQPFSSAGKQSGAADDRHLWPQWFRLIRECRPDAIIGEQVAGAVGFGWLDRVFADLEAAGYACGAAVLGAHSVGAPHIRQRLFWVADAEATGCQVGGRLAAVDGSPARQGSQQTDLCLDARAGGLGDATGNGCGRRGQPQHAIEQGACGLQPDGSSAGGFWGGALWLPCLDGKARRAEPGIFPLVTGLPAAMDGLGPISRVGALRGAGNAITPQVAAAFVTAFMEISDAAN